MSQHLTELSLCFCLSSLSFHAHTFSSYFVPSVIKTLLPFVSIPAFNTSCQFSLSFRPCLPPQALLYVLLSHTTSCLLPSLIYKISSLSFFKKNGPTPASFNLFSSFQTHITIFTPNKCEKMSIQYTVPGFKLMTFGT